MNKEVGMVVGTRVNSDILLRDQLLVMMNEPRAESFLKMIKDLNPEQMREALFVIFSKHWVDDEWNLVQKRQISRLVKKLKQGSV
jgi:hypothetical protein